MNFDARSQEQLTVGANSTIVPAVKIGSPITLATLDTVFFENGEDARNGISSGTDNTQCSSDYAAAGTAGSYVNCYEKYSERAVISAGSAFTITNGDRLEMQYDGTTVQDLKDLVSGANGTAAYTYIQYDFRSLNGGSDDKNVYLNFTVGDDDADTAATSSVYGSNVDSRFNTGLIGQALFNSPGAKVQGFGSLTGSDDLEVIVEFNEISDTMSMATSAGASIPITMDFVTFGQSNDGVNAGDRHTQRHLAFRS